MVYWHFIGPELQAEVFSGAVAESRCAEEHTEKEVAPLSLPGRDLLADGFRCNPLIGSGLTEGSQKCQCKEVEDGLR